MKHARSLISANVLSIVIWCVIMFFPSLSLSFPYLSHVFYSSYLCYFFLSFSFNFTMRVCVYDGNFITFNSSVYKSVDISFRFMDFNRTVCNSLSLELRHKQQQQKNCFHADLLINLIRFDPVFHRHHQHHHRELISY